MSKSKARKVAELRDPAVARKRVLRLIDSRGESGQGRANIISALGLDGPLPPAFGEELVGEPAREAVHRRSNGRVTGTMPKVR